MEVFDLQISDEELRGALSRVYRQELVLRSYDIEVSSELPTRQLAKAKVFVQTAQGVQSLELLIKESSRHELIALSLANKALPYSSPRVVLYKFSPRGVWVVLENVSLWVDADGGEERTNERMVDGLYVIHKAFLGNTDVLSSNFSAFPTASEEQLRASISRVLSDIDGLRENQIVVGLFENWGSVREKIDALLDPVEPFTFPMAFLHGSYYPNTVRGLSDAQGRFHVVAYDWQYSAIGWPQLDLALLLDRLDVISRFRGQRDLSPVLLGRYWIQLYEDFPDLDYGQFSRVYTFCYLCRALPLVRWWLKAFIANPTRDPGRAVLEVETKFNWILERSVKVRSETL